MKKIITIAALAASTFTAFSQSLNYNNLGILFSRNDNYGTSRFNAMSGAFGALGSDISSIAINPAGAAISRTSKAGITLGLRSSSADTNYYGSTDNFQDEHFNASQAGAILVYNTKYDNSNWNRFALSFNYRLKSDFNSAFIAKGNGDYIYFRKSPNKTNGELYERGVSQTFDRTTSGQSSEVNVGFSAVHDNKLFVGASLNFHNMIFSELAKLSESNDDINNNQLDALNVHESTFQGNGFSLGLGFIYKFNQNIRLGIAYETPTWYQEIIEETNVIEQDINNPNKTDANGYVEITTTDSDGSNPITYSTPNDFNTYTFRFRSPSRLTASGAYVFGKKGLISIDYTYKTYTSIRFNNGDFNDVNQKFSKNYRDTHALNVGAEWRFDKASVRGGYHYEKNPNLLLGGNTNTDNVRGFSAGLGYNFGNTQVDLSYYQTQNTDFYELYELNDLNVVNNNSRITGTITFNL